jgi:hypothetical protein
MNCGRQKSLPVPVQYDATPVSQAGVKGSVRAIQFEAENQGR